MRTEANPPTSPPAPDPEMRGLGIADFCIRRPVFATMINLLLVVLGWFSFQSIGIDQLPNVDLPDRHRHHHPARRVAGGSRNQRHQAAGGDHQHRPGNR